MSDNAEVGAGVDLAAARGLHKAIVGEVSKVVLGQAAIIEQVLVALAANGHCLLVGVPGLAKTVLVNTLAQSMHLDFSRIQFTPDLMPSDITGTDILEQRPDGSRDFVFRKGPMFTNLLLADEINRTPPKTQAALLEAMQERRVTVSGTTYHLGTPFFVLATQNPVEQEGTYPLPEAQLDRFMFSLYMDYPESDDEREVILRTTSDFTATVNPVVAASTLIGVQRLVRQMPVSPHVAQYAVDLIRATRPERPEAPDFIRRWLRWGAGTRAGQYLLLAAKAGAVFNGRANVSCADVRSFAIPVLRHRLFCNFAAASEGVNTADVVRKLLEAVPEPQYKE